MVDGGSSASNVQHWMNTLNIDTNNQSAVHSANAVGDAALDLSTKKQQSAPTVPATNNPLSLLIEAHMANMMKHALTDRYVIITITHV